MKKQFILSFIFLVLLTNIMTKNALAYVDPGSTGHLFQILFILFSAGIASLAMGTKKIFGFLSLPFKSLKKLLTRKNK